MVRIHSPQSIDYKNHWFSCIRLCFPKKTTSSKSLVDFLHSVVWLRMNGIIYSHCASTHYNALLQSHRPNAYADADCRLVAYLDKINWLNKNVIEVMNIIYFFTHSTEEYPLRCKVVVMKKKKAEYKKGSVKHFCR